MADIYVYGTFKNNTKSGVLAKTDQLFDDYYNQMQSEINKKVADDISNIKISTGNLDIITDEEINALINS